jgi:hypothetical protein
MNNESSELFFIFVSGDNNIHTMCVYIIICMHTVHTIHYSSSSESVCPLVHFLKHRITVALLLLLSYAIIYLFFIESILYHTSKNRSPVEQSVLATH